MRSWIFPFVRRLVVVLLMLTGFALAIHYYKEHTGAQQGSDTTQAQAIKSGPATAPQNPTIRRTVPKYPGNGPKAKPQPKVTPQKPSQVKEVEPAILPAKTSAKLVQAIRLYASFPGKTSRRELLTGLKAVVTPKAYAVIREDWERPMIRTYQVRVLPNGVILKNDLETLGMNQYRATVYVTTKVTFTPVVAAGEKSTPSTTKKTVRYTANLARNGKQWAITQLDMPTLEPAAGVNDG